MTRSLKILLVLAAGILVFLSGLFIPPSYQPLKTIVLIFGGVLVLSFYFMTLLAMIKSHSSNKIFWMVAILCMPVVGNAIYIIFTNTANRKQVLKDNW